MRRSESGVGGQAKGEPRRVVATPSGEGPSSPLRHSLRSTYSLVFFTGALVVLACTMPAWGQTTPYTATFDETVTSGGIEYISLNNVDYVHIDTSNAGVFASGTRRAAITFDLTSIPAGVTITDVQLQIVPGTTLATHTMDVWSLENDPDPSAGATVYTDCADGTKYVSAWTALQSAGTKTTSLGASAVSSLQTALDTSRGWWGVGLSPLVSSSTEASMKAIEDATAANRPVFIVTVGPKTLSSLSVTQASTDVVDAGSTNNKMLRIPLSVSGGSPGGDLTLTSVTITSGNTLDSDISAGGVKLWFTTSDAFATTQQLGAGGTFSGGSVTIGGLSQVLPMGASYLWVSYDIAGAATWTRLADAKIPAGGINIAASGDAVPPGAQPAAARSAWSSRRMPFLAVMPVTMMMPMNEEMFMVVALAPSARPVTMPAAIASTFLAAPPISTPRTSVEW